MTETHLKIVECEVQKLTCEKGELLVFYAPPEMDTPAHILEWGDALSAAFKLHNFEAQFIVLPHDMRLTKATMAGVSLEPEEREQQ